MLLNHLMGTQHEHGLWLNSVTKKEGEKRIVCSCVDSFSLV